MISRRAALIVGGITLNLLIAPQTWADGNSRGPNGTNAVATGLTGAGVVVGQLEPDLPATGFLDASNTPLDTAATINNLVPVSGVYMAISPIPAVFAQNTSPVADDHAEGVAGTIISTGVMTAGSAVGASLFSASTYANSSQTINSATGNYRNGILAGQRLDTTAGMKAVNMSFGYRYGAANLDDYTGLDGTNQFTQYVDWSASRYNVVNVVAGNESGGSIGADIPTDSYNGIVVSAATTGGDGRYTSVAQFNVVDRLPTVANGLGTSLRRTVDIMAPGQNLTLADDAGNGSATGGNNGTSFAAPQVTAAVALMSQEATIKSMGTDGQNHNVFKAVLMNSVDKVQGILGMDRTITRSTTTDNLGTDEDTATVAESGMNWLQARAYESTNGVNRVANPLDTQMGTGELNDQRAKTQLDAGEQHPGPVNFIGWDYNHFNADEQGAQAHYTLPTLGAGAWVSATLDWDRKITLNNNATGGTANAYDAESYIDLTGGTANQFDPGEPLLDLNGNATFDAAADSFSVTGTNGLNDLDLYLLPVGDTTLTDALDISQYAESISSIDNVEHLFFQVPDAGNYDLVVVAHGLPLGAQDYGFAWWTEVPEPSSLALLIVGGAMALVRRRAASRRSTV